MHLQIVNILYYRPQCSQLCYFNLAVASSMTLECGLLLSCGLNFSQSEELMKPTPRIPQLPPLSNIITCTHTISPISTSSTLKLIPQPPQLLRRINPSHDHLPQDDHRPDKRRNPPKPPPHLMLPRKHQSQDAQQRAEHGVHGREVRQHRAPGTLCVEG